jgi:IS5 family transposase
MPPYPAAPPLSASCSSGQHFASGFLQIRSYVKTRFRGLTKNTAQLVTLFALSNLWMARRHLLSHAGEVHL